VTSGNPDAGQETAGYGAQQWLAQVAISPAVLELRPDYSALLILADGLRAGLSDPASEALLHDAEARARGKLAGRPPEGLDHIQEWREAYRSFGAKPQRTRPSVEALLRRLEGGLPRVDRITDAYNAVSVAHLLPIGGEDRASYAGPARLVRAKGDELFDTISDGAAAVEHPDPGEVVWRDDAGVTCRRWNWRQCTRTRITPATSSAVFILDGLSTLGPDGLRAAGRELIGALAQMSPDTRFASRQLGSGHNSPGVQLRPARPSDIRSIAEFQTDCWREAYRSLVPPAYLDRVSVEDREARWHDRLLSGARQIALAEVDGALVGVVSWGYSDTPDAPALELMSLYVAAEHRGTGVAAALIERALGKAPAHLWVFEDNPRAQAFYLRHGFRSDGHRKVDPDTGLWEMRFIRR